MAAKVSLLSSSMLHTISYSAADATGTGDIILYQSLVSQLFTAVETFPSQ